ncbi:sulfur oxidation c-type cytochrome SoxA [Ramlibacter sp. USB13]|uniref:L-cysteine S-thiosulfotransferase subunit SoxA n=1 Tax=Ramlibacter cellulosilyticus TaxID=2764187 RepID=A0A923SF78_9BURK|nr:sulfur oxidation c-type cytochrome SoxA [Ramlibacter cellulosilyticus]MBC5783672.1 sulfur oxidation c-type cytochrome SoxA [Ramlibacter cellulosilyticus]
MRRAAAVLALVLLGCAAPPAADTRRSGFEDMGASTQAMQRDDAQNPAMLWVQDGEQLWTRGERSCAACHGDPKGMRGVAARYPAWDATLRRPVDLATRINLCRQRHQQQPALPPEHGDLLALEAFLALQSRGTTIRPDEDARLQTFLARGEAAWRQRIGQLELSCAQCHDERAGGRLGPARIPQGHATGYPLYRLEWQSLGSLGRRIRGCMTGVRAEPFAYGSVEMTELELYLARRAMGMPWEGPAVRP